MLRIFGCRTRIDPFSAHALLAGLRTSAGDPAAEPGDARRRRLPRPSRDDPGRHPRPGADAVRLPVDRRNTAERRWATRCGTTGPAGAASVPRRGRSRSASDGDGEFVGIQELSASAFALAAHRAHRLVARPCVPGPWLRAPRCAPPCSYSPSSTSERPGPRVARSSTTRPRSMFRPSSDISPTARNAGSVGRARWRINQRLLVTPETFRRPDWSLRVTGLDACRELLGLPSDGSAVPPE